MTSFQVLLCAAAATLLAASVESSSGGSYSNYNFELSGQALTDLYNRPVHLAERVERPLGGSSGAARPFSHTGVRVTLGDGSQWLIHKGDGFGLSSQTVVTDARHMSSAWKTIRTKDFGGTRTVSDFVSAGGPNYNLVLDNCHLGSRRMMNQ
ncbi:uncharacterized protein LOC119616837 [Kryptolebias marmoratus]|uniref:Uncharacterized protein n=1 Tax=Kryptolebias marmoratus TaxID=37003 RepID=A0A3Q3AVI5_KRYMA|nr:uncharacterized protein LOC119616837 [Kryptolebias marmoratus]